MQLRDLLKETRRYSPPEPVRNADLLCPVAISAARGHLGANAVAMSAFLVFSRVVLFLFQMQIF
jgi:hypothetical protein